MQLDELPSTGMSINSIVPSKPGQMLYKEMEIIASTRQQLLASIRGQTVRIPDLKPYFASWPTTTSVHVDRLRQDVQQWINKYS
jgi:hypothetical protein